MPSKSMANLGKNCGANVGYLSAVQLFDLSLMAQAPVLNSNYIYDQALQLQPGAVIYPIYIEDETATLKEDGAITDNGRLSKNEVAVSLSKDDIDIIAWLEENLNKTFGIITRDMNGLSKLLLGDRFGYRLTEQLDVSGKNRRTFVLTGQSRMPEKAYLMFEYIAPPARLYFNSEFNDAFA